MVSFSRGGIQKNADFVSDTEMQIRSTETFNDILATSRTRQLVTTGIFSAFHFFKGSFNSMKAFFSKTDLHQNF